MDAHLVSERTAGEIVIDLKEEIFDWIESYSIKSQFQKKDGEKNFPCRGGAAIGYKQNGEICLFVKNLNTALPDFWGEDSQYGCYASYKCVTALMNEKDTSDTGESFSFDGAVHAGGCVFYIPELDAWISIAFSGFDSPEDKMIAFAALKEFFAIKE